MAPLGPAANQSHSTDTHGQGSQHPSSTKDADLVPNPAFNIGVFQDSATALHIPRHSKNNNVFTIDTSYLNDLPASYYWKAIELGARGLTAAAAFWCVTAYVLAQLIAMFSIVSWVVLAAIAEVSFFFLYFRKMANRLNMQPVRHEPVGHDPMKAFNRVLETARLFRGKLDLKVYLVNWFCGADMSVIKRDNVADLMAYGFWYKSRKQMEGLGLGHVPMQMVHALENAFGLQLPDGYTPGLRFMYHLWEPLRIHYRPLCFYLLMEVLAVMSKAMLLAMGGRMAWHEGMMYVTYNLKKSLTSNSSNSKSANVHNNQLAQGVNAHHSQQAEDDKIGTPEQLGAVQSLKSDTPIVFLHGIGSGLLLYMNMVRCLMAAGQPLVAVEYKHVSMRLCNIIPSADNIAEAVVTLIHKLDYKKACIVGHSYGTFVSSRMAQLHADVVQSLALLDPVCFGMFMPHLLGNFIYRAPRRDTLFHFIKDHVIQFVSRDMHCAAAFCRRFYWSDVNLWPQDLPGRTLVVLAGQDELIHVDEVLDFVQHYATKVLYHPSHAHAQFMLDPAWQDRVIAEIVGMAAAGDAVERKLSAVQADMVPSAQVSRAPSLVGRRPSSLVMLQRRTTSGLLPDEQLLMNLADLGANRSAMLPINPAQTTRQSNFVLPAGATSSGKRAPRVRHTVHHIPPAPTGVLDDDDSKLTTAYDDILASVWNNADDVRLWGRRRRGVEGATNRGKDAGAEPSQRPDSGNQTSGSQTQAIDTYKSDQGMAESAGNATGVDEAATAAQQSNREGTHTSKTASDTRTATAASAAGSSMKQPLAKLSIPATHMPSIPESPDSACTTPCSTTTAATAMPVTQQRLATAASTDVRDATTAPATTQKPAAASTAATAGSAADSASATAAAAAAITAATAMSASQLYESDDDMDEDLFPSDILPHNVTYNHSPLEPVSINNNMGSQSADGQASGSEHMADVSGNQAQPTDAKPMPSSCGIQVTAEPASPSDNDSTTGSPTFMLSNAAKHMHALVLKRNLAVQRRAVSCHV